MKREHISRCAWVTADPLYIDYHDNEWGIPVHEDPKLFEAIVLDAFQAGLSWLTVLRKRENFRNCFDNFDAKKIANYKGKKIIKLLNDKGVIRNKLKIEAAITNAKAFLNIQEEFGSFDKYIWQFVNYKTIVNRWNSIDEIPVNTIESDTMSNDLKSKGFKFVGTTICYAFMQAVGMINDHTIDCFRYRKL
ncbi:MAG: DNA-3-methyladenine glycosylase I [Bacteroidota bacterium]